MPKFYEPNMSLMNSKISIYPYFPHFHHFSAFQDSTHFELIDVQQSLYKIVDQIISSNMCISSSLHGLIIAQAYGIPWVCLNLYEPSLDGHDFKFEDFYLTLKYPEKVCRSQFLLKDLNEMNLKALSRNAVVNEFKYDLDALLESCPGY